MKKPANRPENARPMVEWYNPLQLGRTAIEVMVSTFFGRHSDHRLIEAVIASKGRPWRDYTYFHVVDEGYKDSRKDLTRTHDRPGIIVDYVADTGDGWDSTYSVAYAIAHTDRCVPKGEDKILTKRGTLLILGGDQVYPTASRKEYAERLTLPYESALKRTGEEHPHVLAIPGNHDWYDSLVSFTRMFISKEWFAGWFAPQDRSYFACKLPGGWWLLGVDTQLGADIDGPQVEYFEKVAEAFKPDDRVILCCAEPQWIYEKFYNKFDADVYTDSNLYYLNRTVLKDRVRVFVSGDLHHYRRHQNRKGVQKITAGGGGAFTHPTHRPRAVYLQTDQDPERKRQSMRSANEKRNSEHTAHVLIREGICKRDYGPDPFKRVVSYPTERRSWWLAFGNLLFPFRNPKFGFVTAALYLITAWVFGILRYIPMQDTPALSSGTIADTIFLGPAAGFWTILLIGSWVLFTDTHSCWYRSVAGITHGSMHLIAALALGIFATWVVSKFGVENHVCSYLWRLAIVCIGGWYFGGTIMGLYLLVSLNGFGRHYTEAFSSLAIRDYKCFLRFHIRADGSLTIYPLKIHRIPRKWEQVRTEEEEHRMDAAKEPMDRAPLWEPVDRRLKVELIEEPISVTKTGPVI